MHQSDKISVICVVYDRVANLDSLPRLYSNEAHAMRDFRQNVNMPSDYALFHTPGDFELVKLSEFSRDDVGQVVFSLNSREVLLTGTAAVDQSMRETYIKMSSLIQEQPNASKQVS